MCEMYVVTTMISICQEAVKSGGKKSNVATKVLGYLASYFWAWIHIQHAQTKQILAVDLDLLDIFFSVI